MELYIATSNVGKLREFERLLAPLQLQIKTLKDVPAFTMPNEDGKTFYENARKKAKALHAVKNTAWVLADDSGLEVEGLNHLPGVHSARYAGNNASDRENYLKILKMLDMRSPTNRKAQFKCVLVVFSPEGEEFQFEGELKGSIGKAPKGTDGFGYDPVFIPEGETLTLAELGLAQKNRLSHRARALSQLIQKIGPRLSQM